MVQLTAKQRARIAQQVFEPTADDRRILKALAASRGTLVQVAIEEATRISRKTVGKRLRVMLRYNLLHYPHGARKGAAITPEGRELLEAPELANAT